MVTLENTTKSVKVLKAFGLKTLRVIPGYNYVDLTEDELKEYVKSKINQSVIKESIKLIDIELTGDDDKEAKIALEKNENLNKAQKIISKQNEQILEKDKTNDVQAETIKTQGKQILDMMEKIKALEKKDKK